MPPRGREKVVASFGILMTINWLNQIFVLIKHNRFVDQ